MGVPKFFRYISERYPCLSELVRENQIPEFDNLYLDMNGIIHVCSHPNDNDPHFRISEENIFKDIAHYIEVLFRMIQPQKLFFMAVDGVAPRAKMNQQRGRRFRSAKEAEDLEKAAKAKGEELPKEARFDSNCITPGTAFMARLQDYLKLFVKRKMNTDTNWQKCRVILSGHETPGEGEHKIMEYIRYLKASPGYDANTRHCLYGLDADLIMLGLCSHEPHFSLLREEVKFGKQANSRSTTAEETKFYLLHLSLLRDYLEQEFWSVRDKLPFRYDLESIIDDWIFMGFLVGNDFIPHLPNLHINSNALPLLYDVYKEILPTLDGYINECGCLNLSRLEKFIEKLAVFDRAHFSDANADLKYFAAKRCDDAWLPEQKKSDEPEHTIKNKELLDLVSAVDDLFLEDTSPDTESDADFSGFDIRSKDIIDMTDEEIFEEEFISYKKDYYMNKLGYKAVTSDVLAEQSECYIRALQWTLLYYYKGVCSWGWYYPHHYAPFISDIRNFKDLDYKFNLGKPFLPFQQLLAVLPSASGALLPEAFRKLMVSPESPILHYYPTTFETDLNGKRQEWEAVVLIPFIEEDSLLKAMSQQEHLLTTEEVSRNIHGPMLQYDYIVTSSIPDLTTDVPDRPKDFVSETKVHRSELYVPPEKLVLGPIPGAKFDVYFPGFPTMKHLQYKSRLEKGKVRVFEQITRNDSMIVEIENMTELAQIDEVAKRVLGRSVFVQWPHLVESRVMSVMNNNFKYSLNNQNEIIKEPHTEVSRNDFLALIKGNKKHYYERLGIDITDTHILLRVLQMKNRVYIFGKQGRITLEKEWASIPSNHPLQTCVLDLKVHNSQFVQYDTVDEIFSKYKDVFLLGQPYYGNKGTVLGIENNGRLKISVYKPDEPNFLRAKQMYANNLNSYHTGYDAAAKVGISNYLLGRITGTIYIIPGNRSGGPAPPQDSFRKYNIGLNLKYTKKNEELTGFTRRVEHTWYYSLEAIALLRNYSFNFPEVFQTLNHGNYNDTYYESDLYPDAVGLGKLELILDWLKKQPHNEAIRKSSDSEALTRDVVEEVIEASRAHLKKKGVMIAIKPIHVFVPGLQPESRAPDPEATFKLFDRVVNVRTNHTVPLGHKGTVVGLHKSREPNPIHQEITDDIFLDVVFDDTFEGATAYAGTAEKRCYRMTPTSLINLTFGAESGTKKLLVVKNSQSTSSDSSSAKVTPNTSAISVDSYQQRTPAKNEMLMNPKQKPYTPPRGLLQVNNDQKQNILNSPEERKQFWDDLMNHKNLTSPKTTNIDEGTETLKQILGVTKNSGLQPQEKLALALKPEKSYSFSAGCKSPAVSNPINLQDMFNHARASTSGALNLPPPPMQWYGSPNNLNDPSKTPKNKLNDTRIEPTPQSNSFMNSPLVSNILAPSLMSFVLSPGANHQLTPTVPPPVNHSKSDVLENNSPNRNSIVHTSPQVDNMPSAFIPLQAVKKGRLRNNSQTQLNDTETPVTNEGLDEQIKSPTLQKRKEIQRIQEQNQQDFQKYLFTGQEIPANLNSRVVPIKGTPKGKKKKSRIAANFGTPL